MGEKTKSGLEGEKMEIEVITAGVLKIDGVMYHQHPNGGGLVAETAKVAETA